jgi:hypothetical protein
MAPTVRQATRIKPESVVLSVRTASQATVSSNVDVNPLPWRAQGTCATTTPCSAHSMRGASASMNARTVTVRISTRGREDQVAASAAQRSGRSSSTRLAGWDCTRTSTSARYV